MKVAFSTFKWIGLGLSLSALLYEVFVSLPTAFLTFFIFITFPFITFSIIVNSIATAKIGKGQASIALGVLQCITITGFFAGIFMILAACFRKKAEACDEEIIEVIEYVVEE